MHRHFQQELTRHRILLMTIPVLATRVLHRTSEPPWKKMDVKTGLPELMVNFVTSSYKPELLEPLVEKISSIPEVIAKIISDRDFGRSRGFGFVNFSSEDSAQTAMSAMDGQELNGRSIRVNFANERPSGTRYGSGDGDGGYSGGGGGYHGNQGGYGNDNEGSSY